MSYQYLPYCLPLWISSISTFLLGLYILVKRRSAKGAVSFILSMFLITVWSSASALEMLGADLTTKLFWANVQYVAYCYSPVTLVALCMEFTGFDNWVKNRKVLWLAVIPTIVLLLVWTDGIHGLVRYNIHMSYSGLFPVIEKKYGPVFYFHAAYSHLLNLFAWALLINAAFFKNSIYRKQAFSLLMGLSLIIFSNLVYICKFIPFYQFDITPMFFGPAGFIAAWGLFRYKLFEVIPVAWATVLRIMDTGIMIMDMQGRVLDVNPAFEKIMGLNASTIIAKPGIDVCGRIPELKEACADTNLVHSQFSIHTGEVQKIYEAIFSPLLTNIGTPIGRLVIIHEITKQKQEEEEFLKQQWKLAVNEERERMARDLHDNLGQVLGFVNLQAQGIQQELKNSGIEMVSGQLNKLIDATQSAHTELRNFIRSIRDPAYNEKDFLIALKKDISGFEDQTGLSVALNIPAAFTGENMKPNIRIQILSILKEAFNNIRKHADAENVKVWISIKADIFRVIIEDDGKGFHAAQNTSTVKTKFGLDIMHERAEEIGGTLQIDSSCGKGCRVTLCVPIENGDEKIETDAC